MAFSRAATSHPVPARWLQADHRPPCPHCRATVDEVETDVVEIEAKLDKVREGGAHLV